MTPETDRVRHASSRPATTAAIANVRQAAAAAPRLLDQAPLYVVGHGRDTGGRLVQQHVAEHFVPRARDPGTICPPRTDLPFSLCPLARGEDGLSKAGRCDRLDAGRT